MLTEAQLFAQRATLRHLARLHPEWTRQELAAAVGSALSTVKKWLRAFVLLILMTCKCSFLALVPVRHHLEERPSL